MSRMRLEDKVSIQIDLHVHSKVSKAIPFDLSSFERTAGRAMKVGLDGFAVTEHIHSFDFWRAMGVLAARFEHDNGVLRVGKRGFPVLTGMELSVAIGEERGDTIVIGPIEKLWALDHSFSPTLNEGYHPSLEEAISQIRKLGLIVIGAHAFRPGKMLSQVGENALAQLDALEVNGKDMADWRADETIVPLAKKLGLAVVGSSDAHLWPQVGVQRTVVPGTDVSFGALKEAISARETAFASHPNCRTLVRVSKAHKTIIKARIGRTSGQTQTVPRTPRRVIRRSRRLAPA